MTIDERAHAMLTEIDHLTVDREYLSRMHALFSKHLAAHESAIRADERRMCAERVKPLQRLIDAAIEYIEYEHNGDPWVEDARLMGEMALDELDIDECKAAIRAIMEGE